MHVEGVGAIKSAIAAGVQYAVAAGLVAVPMVSLSSNAVEPLAGGIIGGMVRWMAFKLTFWEGVAAVATGFLLALALRGVEVPVFEALLKADGLKMPPLARGFGWGFMGVLVLGLRQDYKRSKKGGA